MAITVNVNKLSLCHKGSPGLVTATLPDVCKTPSPGGPVPVPYPNIAFAKHLSKGSKKVKADGGNSAAIKGSEFMTSTGDEPGSVGGIKSGIIKGKATWLSWSFDVKIEGKNACRLTDKMLMNKGNTASLGGYVQPPIIPDDIIYKLCKIACSCRNDTYKQICMAIYIEEKYYEDSYPKPDSPVWREVSMRRGDSGWEIIKNGEKRRKDDMDRPPLPGSVPTSVRWTPRGGIRPDLVLTDGAGNPTRMIEVKFPNDSLNDNQKLGARSPYSRAARDLGVEYDVLDLNPPKKSGRSNPCAFCQNDPIPHEGEKRDEKKKKKEEEEKSKTSAKKSGTSGTDGSSVSATKGLPIVAGTASDV